MAFSKFLDPKNAFCFRQIFGTEKNKDILIHFLNDILKFEGSEKITEVTAKIPEPNIVDERSAVTKY